MQRNAERVIKNHRGYRSAEAFTGTRATCWMKDSFEGEFSYKWTVGHAFQ